MSDALDSSRGEPDFINELGTKWWRDTDLTAYAQNEDQFGTTLAAVCYEVETAAGYRTRVLVALDSRAIIEEDQSLEGLACKIEVRKLLQRDAAREAAAAKPKPRPAPIKSKTGRRMPPERKLGR